MGISEQDRTEKYGATGFWAVAGLLFVVAVVVRWWRLDLMSFNFDQAAICERAMELFGGRIPFTGIINSIGFRNAPGYVWSLLPAFLITCNPLAASAWHGLLCGSIVFPLAMTGKQFRRDGLLWLPAVFAAFLPVEILAGRTLWAQYLVTPLAGWGLWALVCALDDRRCLRTRQRFGAAALALMTWAVSVHYGAAPVLVITAVALTKIFLRSDRRGKMHVLLPSAIIMLTMLPSFGDLFHQVSNPRPKPAYAVKYESELPEPLPWWARVTQAASACVINGSADEPTFEVTLPGKSLAFLRTYDAIAALCVLAGFVSALWQILAGRNSRPSFSRTTSILLFAWIVVPILIGGLFLKRVQPSYFAASLPAAWLMVLFLPQLSKFGALLRWFFYFIVILIAGGGTWTLGEFLRIVSDSEIVAANYYIPFKREKQVADYLQENGITGGHILHLSGPIYEKAFVYLADCKPDHSGPHVETTQKYAVLVDRSFIEDKPDRVNFVVESGAVAIGQVLIKTFPTRGAAEIFARQYYGISK